MCVCVCERERECVCVCVRERESVCVCERERERVCVCVCVRRGLCDCARACPQLPSKPLVSALVLSRLDYRNSFPSGCSQTTKSSKQRLVLRVPKTDHISPHLASLYWLRIDVCARALARVCFECFHFLLCNGLCTPVCRNST